MANEGIAFGRSLIDRYIQFKMLQRAERQDQLRLELPNRREQRYSDQLQSNRRFAQQGRAIQQRQFERTQERLEGTAASLREQRLLPKRGTKEDFQTQGYDPETAQRLQDQSVGLLPKPTTPYQRATAGKMMMENATTTDMFNKVFTAYHIFEATRNK